jgi:hypothetical protein
MKKGIPMVGIHLLSKHLKKLGGEELQVVCLGDTSY